MDEAVWADAGDSLARAADSMAILARCLDVGPQLGDWRRTADQVRGGDAANALDQARGILERMMGGEAQALIERIETVLDDLPAAWE